MNFRLILSVCALLLGVSLCAGEDVELHINGKFRGATAGADSAPGWVPDNAIGSSQILKGRKSREFKLEITASDTSPKSVSSEFYPAPGFRLTVELKHSGSGQAQVACVCYDQQRQQIGSENATSFATEDSAQERELRFALPPGTAFIRLVLSAMPKSTVCFEDVKAEYSLDRAPAGVPQIAVDIKKGKVGLANAPAAHVDIPSSAAKLENDKWLFYRKIPAKGVYRGEITFGGDFDVDLGENSHTGTFWQVMSYDSSVCIVKIDHRHIGFGAFNLDRAEVEIEPLTRGSVQVDLSCGQKQVTVYVTAR